eukprot:m51a1_g1121 hypothetical protein (88) ;mRNA; r:183300-183651
MADESRGETLERSEAGKLGGTAYKATERAKEVGEAQTLDEVLSKKAAGEKLTPRERGILGGKSRSVRGAQGSEAEELGIVPDDVPPE